MLAEAVLRNGIGARVGLDRLALTGVDPFTALFSESTGRVLVAVTPGLEDEFLAAATDVVPLTELGLVDTDVDGLVVVAGPDASFGIDHATLSRTHKATLPGIFGP